MPIILLAALTLSGCTIGGPPPQPAPLHDAAREGDVARVRSLLDAGADINAMNNGDTALTWASYNKQIDIVEELCKRGADLNKTTGDGFTPIYIGVRWGGAAVAKILLAYGADVSIRVPYDGKSALEYAQANNLADVLGLIKSQPELVAAKRAQLERERASAALGEVGNAGEAVKVAVVVPNAELRARGIRSVALPNFVASPAEAELAKNLSNVALGAAATAKGLRVVGASDIDAMLGLEAKKDMLGCSDVSCMAQIGGALGVDALLSLKVGRVGETFVLNADLIDIKRSEVVARGAANWKGASDALIGITKTLVYETLSPVTLE